MFKRIYSNLFYPSEAGKYLKDKVGYVILYILFLSLLAHIPTIIQASYTDLNEENLIETFLLGIASEKITSEIIEYEYTGDSIEPFAVDKYVFLGFNSDNINSLGFTFIFKDETLDVYVGNNEIKNYSYLELNLDNVNFNLKDSADTEKIEKAFSIIYKDFKTYIVIGESIGAILIQAMFAILLILLFVGLYSFQEPKLLLKYRFILVGYSSTVYFFTLLLDNLFGLTIFSLIGIFIMGFNFRKAFIKTMEAILIQGKEEDEDE